MHCKKQYLCFGKGCARSKSGMDENRAYCCLLLFFCCSVLEQFFFSKQLMQRYSMRGIRDALFWSIAVVEIDFRQCAGCRPLIGLRFPASGRHGTARSTFLFGVETRGYMLLWCCRRAIVQTRLRLQLQLRGVRAGRLVSSGVVFTRLFQIFIT